MTLNSRLAIATGVAAAAAIAIAYWHRRRRQPAAPIVPSRPLFCCNVTLKVKPERREEVYSQRYGSNIGLSRC
jgi:hypothetical protein